MDQPLQIAVSHSSVRGFRNICPPPAADTLSEGQRSEPSGPAGSRPTLLISVRDELELQLLRAHPVKYIDLKEPSRGSLGCPSPNRISGFLHQFAKVFDHPAEQPRLTLACGDLDESECCPVAPEYAPAFQWLKVGVLSSRQLQELGPRLAAWRASSNRPQHWVPCFYADLHAGNIDEFERFVEAACHQQLRAVLIDTKHKNGRSTLDAFTPHRLAEMIRRANHSGLPVMVAGGLRSPEVSLVHECGAAIIGVRSAICAKGLRQHGIDSDRLQALWRECGYR